MTKEERFTKEQKRLHTLFMKSGTFEEAIDLCVAQNGRLHPNLLLVRYNCSRSREIASIFTTLGQPLPAVSIVASPSPLEPGRDFSSTSLTIVDLDLETAEQIDARANLFRIALETDTAELELLSEPTVLRRLRDFPVSLEPPRSACAVGSRIPPSKPGDAPDP